MTTVIVGAGPAGIRAAQTLLAHGVKATVVDESRTWGGQIYRQQPVGFTRPPATLYGFEAGRATALHEAMASMVGALDYRPETLVWNAEATHLDVVRQGRGEKIVYEKLIVATGATDRILPFAGWTTPGVYTLGGAQVALKYQACAIGSQVVFAGNGPLLYLVAYQYAMAGAKVVAVLDSSRFTDKLAGTARMLAQTDVLAKGLYYTAWLKVHGVKIHEGARPVRAVGKEVVQGLVWHDGSTEHELACDAIGIGYALRSETQIADLLGCRFSFNATQRAWLPECDTAGRSSVPNVYLAGDSAGIRGADAAECAGERAALALLQDSGAVVDSRRVAQLERKLAQSGRFRQGLERAFPFPERWAEQIADDVLVCRCEEITAGDLRAASARCGIRELNRLKAMTRVGMGRCQGRMCGAAAAEILATASAQPVHVVGRLRGQAPIKPLPFSVARGQP